MSETTQSLASGIADPKVSETRSITRKRILLVEGDGFTRLVLLLRFRMAGFEVHFTSNGTLALGKLGNCHPDALLVELQLRGVSGLELIRAARRAPEFGNRPIYVFTCSDLMNRATRKEVRSLATKVFDKRSITLESLVRGVAGMLTPPQETGEPRHATAAEQPAPEALSELLLPGEIEEIVAEVPEPSVLGHSGEQLPINASQMNTDPLSVKELFMKALKEMQSTHAAKHNEPVSATPPSSSPNTEASPHGGLKPAGWPKAAEDGPFMLAPAGSPAVAAQDSICFEPFAAAGRLHPESQVADPKNEAGDGKKTILFIEDDPLVLRIYRKYLKRAGFHVEVAEDGLAALDLLPRVRPDAVVLDLMLPKLHGLEVLKFIRTDVNLKGTPVLVLSNAYLEGLAAQAKQAGANQGILKTQCTPAKLLEQICDLLGHAKTFPSPEPVLHEPRHPATHDDAVSLAETAIWARQAGMLKTAPKEIAKIRQFCLGYIKAEASDDRLAQLTDLYGQVRFLSARAGLSGFTKIAELSSALEGLLFQIVFKQTEATTSTFQTIAQAVDCLDRLIQNRDTTFVEPRSKPRLLLVDDDTDFNFTMVTALKRANFDVVGLKDPIDALRVLKAGCFDLILIEVNLPHVSGFDLCEQVRRMPQHNSAQVIFVTINADFQTRARSIVSGGKDLIGKPVSPLELILKVTMHLLNASGQGASARTEASDVTWVLDATHSEKAIQDNTVQPAPAVANVRERINAALAAASIPYQPFQRIQPAATGAEGLAKPLSLLPTTPIDNLQADDRRLEMLQPSVLQTDPPELPRPEPSIEDQMAEAERLAAAESDTGESVLPVKNGSQPGIEANGTSFAQQWTVAAQNHESDGEQQPQAPQAESAPLPEKYKNERETLVNRIYTAENDLFRTEARLKRREQTIETQQKQLDELIAFKAQLEQQKVENVAEGAQKEAQAQAAQLEQELAQLRQVREELNAKFAQALEITVDSGKRVQELEQRLGQSATELEGAQAELEKQKQEQGRVESDLRRQLEAASDTSKQREVANKQSEARGRQLEQELAGLRQAQEELTGKFGKELQATAESRARIKELEDHLGSKSADLERSKAELENQAKERGRVESDLRQKLESASAATKQSEAAHQQAQARSSQLEQELAGLRQALEELTGKFGKELQATAESRTRIKELEDHLGLKSAELERSNAELDKQAKERGRVESDLRQQLETVSATSKQSEAERKQAEIRSAQLEQELGGLRQAREELSGKFGKELQATAESRARIKELEGHLGSKSAELERSNAELEKQAKERGRAESDLRQQLETVSATSKQSEAAHQQAQACSSQLEQELAGLRQAREELTGKFGKELQATAESRARIKELEEHLGSKSADLERANAELENQAKERGRVESDLRQKLESARAAIKQSEAERKQAEIRSAQLEQELAALRQAREDLSGKFGKELQATAESRARIKELEDHLGSKSAELERSNAELENQAKERGRAESDLRQQLETASAVIKQSEAAHQQAQTRSRQLEQELAGLRQAREDLAGKFGKELQATVESRARIKELEDHLGSKSADLERSKAELEKRVNEHRRLESELRRQLETTAASTVESQAVNEQIIELEQRVRQGVAALTRATADLSTERGERQRSELRAAALNLRLQELHEEFSRVLQSQRVSLERVGALEEQLHRADQTLARRTADFEQQQNEHRLAEEQLQKAKELNSQLRKSLSFFEEANKTFDLTRQDLHARLEASLSAAQEAGAKLQRETAERQRLADSLDAIQRQLENQSRKCETLETELQTTLSALHEFETRFQKEAAQRQQLQETLEFAQLNLQDRSQRSDLECSKLQTALQLEQAERKRQESQIVSIRHVSLDAARSARALRNTMRRQIREPVYSLCQSARSLLELELGEPQKKLAEAVLQDALLVHTSLQETDMPQGDSMESENTAE